MVVGIIIDGNRRWAKLYGLTTKKGHTRGVERVYEIVEHARGKIDHLYVYLLAWHNWQRDPKELAHLVKLIAPVIHRYANDQFVSLQIGHPTRAIGQPIDLVIRTGGHRRLSGFFPEESRNARLIVLKKFWPDFTTDDFDKCLNRFQLTNKS